MKTTISILLTGVLCALPTVALAEPTPDAEAKKLLARFDNEPTVNEVQQAALTYAAMHPEQYETMRTRSRFAAVLPEVRLRVTQDKGDDQKQYQRYSESGAAAEPLSDTSTTDENLELQGEVKWRLNELVFNRYETAVVKEHRQVAKERQRILQSVTQVYFERRRAQVDLLLAPPGDAAGRTLAELKVAELTAELDGMTGGAFSRMAAER
ncbi:hypothetical protein L6V77_30865 [Myxococcota bacterium]|nr:hypothetical protein [Myxococcota bacterium]